MSVGSAAGKESCAWPCGGLRRQHLIGQRNQGRFAGRDPVGFSLKDRAGGSQAKQ